MQTNQHLNHTAASQSIFLLTLQQEVAKFLLEYKAVSILAKVINESKAPRINVSGCECSHFWEMGCKLLVIFRISHNQHGTSGSVIY